MADREALLQQLLDARACLVRGLGGMEALLKVDMTMAQLKTLIFLTHEGVCPMSQLADGLGIGRPAASLLIDRLVQLGLVHRWEDSADRRRTLVELSETGRELASQLYEGGRQQMIELVSHMSDEDLEALVRGLSALAAVVSGGQSLQAPGAAPAQG
jgi:DNA-binding MarR family transcriptional regulator